MRRLMLSFVLVVAGCTNVDTYEPVDYPDLSGNAAQYFADQKKIELRGQIVELVESSDYTALGDPTGSIAFTIESFLLNAGEPLPQPTLKKLRKAYRSGGELGVDAGTVLKGKDLDLVMVRWTPPQDIPQREDFFADPYPVTPGTAVTVQGVLTTDSVEQWKHCRTYRGPYATFHCTTIAGADGLRMEAARVADVEAADFGRANDAVGE